MRKNHLILLAGLLAATLVAGCDDSGSRATVEVRDNPVSDYARVDRAGQPAVASALLRGGSMPVRDSIPDNGADNERDHFNLGDPQGDAAFAPAFVDTLIAVNNALADDLDAVGVPRCAVGEPGSIDSADDIETCIAQAAPVVIPDVITLDLTAPAGWPNGRLPDDPVVDRLLAAALLDLSAEGVGINTLAGLPLNPPGNDARDNDPSPGNFPYLRPPITD